MFNKLLADTYSKVRSKADELRNSVAQHAAKAREALGLPDPAHPSAAALEKLLEGQASHATAMTQLHDMFVRWIAQIVTGQAPDALRYYDDHVAGGNVLDMIGFGLRSGSVNSAHGVAPGDVCSMTTWISLTSGRDVSADQVGASPPPPPPPLPNEPSSPVPPPLEEQESGGTTQGVAAASSSPFSSSSASEHVITEGLTFHEVFLRSQALELTLLSLARIEPAHSRLAVPLKCVAEDEAPTCGALHRLLGLTMQGDAKLHRELFFLFCSIDTSSDVWEAHLRHLAELVAILKLDWLTEHLKSKVRRLQEDIELSDTSLLTHPSSGEAGLRSTTLVTVPQERLLLDNHDTKTNVSPESTRSLAGSLSSCAGEARVCLSAADESDLVSTTPVAPLSPQGASVDTGAAADTRCFNTAGAASSVTSSTEDLAEMLRRQASLTRRKVFLLLELNATRDLLQARQKVVEYHRRRRLQQLLASLTLFRDKFGSLGSQAVDRSECVAAEMATVTKEVDEKIAAAEADKARLNQHIQELESQRTTLLQELDCVNQKLADVTAELENVQRTIQLIDQNRKTLSRAFERKVAVATELKHRSMLHKIDMENVRTLVVQAEVFFDNEKKGLVEVPTSQSTLLAAATRHLSHELQRLQYASSLVESTLGTFQRHWDQCRDTHNVELIRGVPPLRATPDQQRAHVGTGKQADEDACEHRPPSIPSPPPPPPPPLLQLSEGAHSSNATPPPPPPSYPLVSEKKTSMAQPRSTAECSELLSHDLSPPSNSSEPQPLHPLRHVLFEDQQRILAALECLETAWKDVTEFTDVFASRVPSVMEPPPEEDGGGSTPQDDDYVHVGPDLPAVTTPDAFHEFRTFVREIRAVYASTKALISSHTAR